MIDQFESAIQELELLYSVVGIVKLSDGHSALYNQLLSLHKNKYDPHERILVLQDREDVYDYEDLPGQDIVNLQKCLSKIDISNCFVLVISQNYNIAQELAQARLLYSTDQQAIQHYNVGKNLRDTNPVTRQYTDTFCVLPWIHLYAGPDGNVLPCCVADHQFPMGNINQDIVDNILTSGEYNQLRLNMLTGKRSKQCRLCYQKEDSGLPSARQAHNRRWSQIQASQVRPDGVLDQVAPVYLDIRLNNICNLKCRMCSSYFSSAIAQEEVKLFGSSNSVTLSAMQKNTALNDILKFVPAAEKIYFAGGEPLIMSEHYKILDHLIDNNNTGLELIYNTNFTTLQFQGRKVTDLWQKFSNVTLGISLDAEGDVAEYVRSGSNWSTIESNLKLVQQECPHVKIKVASAVGLLNVLSLIKLQRSWHNSGQLPIQQFAVSTIISPDYLSLPALPANHKQRISPLIQEHIAWCQERSADDLASQWKDVLTYMSDNDLSYCQTEFRKVTARLDLHRKESLAKVLPEYKDLL